MKLHSPPQPYWVWRFKHRQDDLGMTMVSLMDSETDAITDETAQSLNIQLHHLDFHTGETSPSARQYFMPADENFVPRQPASVIQRTSFMKEYLRIPSTKPQAKEKRDRNLRQALSDDLELYRAVAKREWKIPGLESFRVPKGMKDVVEHNDKKPAFTVSRAMEMDGGRRGRQCHQIAHLQASEYPDAASPSITELQVMIALIWDRMHQEKKETQMKSKLRRYDASAERITHHVFPVNDELPRAKAKTNTETQTLFITMFPGAQVRVLYGYHDGQFNVQFTDLQQVTASNFEDMMGAILKWSMPYIDGNTTEVVNLPDIIEEDEEEAVEPEEEVREGDKEKKNKKKKRRRKRKNK